jgi:hypothetical protein
MPIRGAGTAGCASVARGAASSKPSVHPMRRVSRRLVITFL